MADVITLKGTTIFDSATTGVGWVFSAGSAVEDANEERAPLGTGYWVKPAGVPAVEHSLTLDWVAADPAAIKAALEALRGVTLGNLVVPIWGTYANCRLSKIADWTSDPVDGNAYAVKTTLTVTQYP